jgi:uncharacterized membrane-anchored protein
MRYGLVGVVAGVAAAVTYQGGVMTLIDLVIVLVVCGVCLYLVETYVPLAPPIKVVIRVVVVLVLVLWLLQAFGIVGPTVPRLR